MSAPTPRETSLFWSALLETNKQADALVERCRRAIEPTQPISREIPAFFTVEALFKELRATLSNTLQPNSDSSAGNNIKRPIYTNGSSRIYVREVSFGSSFITSANGRRIPNSNTDYPFNFRWNFFTSISQRWYSTPRGCLASAGGRARSGNHLSFREPLIIEPMETLVFECELLSFSDGNADVNFAEAAVTMIASGYREGN